MIGPELKTVHRLFYADARERINEKSEGSIELVVTSPPYPMIAMWDDAFALMNQQIGKLLSDGKGDEAFNLMHHELDKVWGQIYDKLVPGGIACINIGDATRKIDGSFKIYPNHSRILLSCTRLGFHALAEILWKKQSNKPNKFMGSGMLPVGAYVTQEHEYILILRKGKKREFHTESDRKARSRSAFFWEERNAWFSDIWEDLKGERQTLKYPGLREKSASYPFELAYRLMSMFSVQGDTVMDPFLGMATTIMAAMATGRNSLGFEISPVFKRPIEARLRHIVDFANDYNRNRLSKHLEFEKGAKGRLQYENSIHGLRVMTHAHAEIS